MGEIQYLARKSKLNEKDFRPFYLLGIATGKRLFGPLVHSNFIKSGSLDISAKNTFQYIENQSYIAAILQMFGFRPNGAPDQIWRLNKYLITRPESPVSKDNSLFLSPTLLLTVRGFAYSLFQK